MFLKLQGGSNVAEVTALATSENLLYDKNWVMHLNNCSFLSTLEYSKIVDWFSTIRNLEVQATVNFGFNTNNAQVVFDKLNSIESVITQYDIIRKYN